jgi:hypothetical protein
VCKNIGWNKGIFFWDGEFDGFWENFFKGVIKENIELVWMSYMYLDGFIFLLEFF